MSSLAPFYKEMFKVCSNGGIPNLKLSAALLNVHGKQAIYHHSKSSLEWCPDAGAKIRMASHNFRELAMYEDKLEIFMRKVWGLQSQDRLGHFSKDFRTFWTFEI